MLPNGFVQELLSRVDVVEVVGRHVELKRAGTVHKGLCPFHGEKTPSFTVSPSRQTYHCFGCGAHGDAIRFLVENQGMHFMDAVRDLAQHAGVTVPESDASPEERARAAEQRQKQASLSEILERAGQHYKSALKSHDRAIDYLKGRGLTGEIAARFGLGYAPAGWRTLASVFGQYDDPALVEAGLVIVQGEDDEQKRYDRFRDRIMFPIRSVRGEVIGFGGRVIDDGEGIVRVVFDGPQIPFDDGDAVTIPANLIAGPPILPKAQDGGSVLPRVRLESLSPEVQAALQGGGVFLSPPPAAPPTARTTPSSETPRPLGSRSRSTPPAGDSARSSQTPSSAGCRRGRTTPPPAARADCRSR